MKQSIVNLAVAAVALAAMTSSASATTYYFTNSAADNDFGNVSNWNTVIDGSGTIMTAFAISDDLDVERSGTDKAILTSASLLNSDDLRVGIQPGYAGELEITSGDHVVNNAFRVGQGGGGIGTFTMSGGTLAVPNSYSTWGNAGTATVTVTGGTLNLDRLTLGQVADDVANVYVSGGTINFVKTDPTPASISGMFTLPASVNAHIYMSGTGVINSEGVRLNGKGTIHMDGGTINAGGMPDAIMTTNVEYNSGVFQIAGDVEAVLDTGIADGYIYTSTAGSVVDAVYDSINDLTSLMLVADTHPGDANGDGMVNLADLQILGDNWQSTTATWAQADFTGDGNVNLADLQILGDNWGFGVTTDVSLDEALAQVAIPEPAALTLMGLGLPLVVRRRHRC